MMRLQPDSHDRDRTPFGLTMETETGSVAIKFSNQLGQLSCWLENTLAFFWETFVPHPENAMSHLPQQSMSYCNFHINRPSIKPPNPASFSFDKVR